MRSLDGPTYVCCGNSLHIGHKEDCKGVATQMRRVIVESPYAGEVEVVEANVRYARRAMRDSISRGEAPLASHLLYTQPNILDDNDPVQRLLGIQCGLAWMSQADAVIFYVDRGISPGMKKAELEAVRLGKVIINRNIGE